MKRIIAAMLCIMTLSAVPFAAVTAASDEVGERRRENIDLFFDAFPVVTDEITGDGVVTRGEFAYIIKNILDRSGITGYGNAEFYDVTSETPYAAEISAAASMGYMRDTNGTGKFRPNDKIADTEAAACIVHMLGCDYIVNLAYTYNAGVWQALDLAGANVTSFAGEKNADWIKNLVFRGLHSNIAVPDGMKNNSLMMKIDKDTTYLEKYWELNEAEGILSKNSFIDIYGKDAAPDNQVVIGGRQYMSYLIYENTEYLGSYVKAYVSTSEENGGRIMCMFPDERYSRPVTIDARTLTNVTDLTSVKTTDEKGRTKTYRLSELANIYYNFDYMGPVRAADYTNPKMSELLSKMKEGRSCRIILAENNNDGKYDFIRICVYENYSVSGYSYEDYTIRDKYGDKLEMREAFASNKIVLLDDNDKQANAADISENDILSLMISFDGEKIEKAEGYLSSRTVSGTVSAVSDGDECTINSETYYVTDRYLRLQAVNNKNVLELKPGLITTFYLNRFSEIAAVSLSDYYRDGTTYAFIIGAYYDANDQSTILKLLNEDGIIQRETLGERVTVNGRVYRSEEIIKALSEISGVPVTDNVCEVYKAARISVSDKKIVKLELAYSRKREEGDSSDRMYPDVILYSYGEGVTLANVVYKNNTFGKSVGITTSSVVFDVPLKENGKAVTDSAAYSTTSVSNMQDDCVLGMGGKKKVNAGSEYMEFFDADSTLFASAAVRYYEYNDSTGGVASPPEMLADCIVVTDVIKDAVNEDDEPVMIIKGYKAGAETELSTAVIKNSASPWEQFPTLTDSTLGAVLEKAGHIKITPEQIKQTGLLPGDVIQITTNAKNEVSNILINVRGGDAENAAWLMGNNTNTSVLSATAGQGNEYLGVNYGSVAELQNGKVVLDELDGARRVYSIGSPTVTVYNRTLKSARKGGNADIQIGSDMYIRQYYSQIKEVVVFEE